MGSQSQRAARDRKRVRTGQQDSNGLKLPAIVRRAPKPVKLPKGPHQFSVPERERDLLAIAHVHGGKRSKRGAKKIRWARYGELVWVRLDKPIAADEHSNPEEGIIFWPGLVEDIQLRVNVSPKKAKNEDVDMHDASSRSPPQTPKIQTDDVPWTISHVPVYRIKLLIVAQSIRVGDDHILPYQAYAPSNSLISAIQRVKIFVGDDDEQAMQRFSLFEPFPIESDGPQLSDRDRLDAAAGPFALAIQVASRVTSFWTPTDQWECKLVSAKEDGMSLRSCTRSLHSDIPRTAGSAIYVQHHVPIASQHNSDTISRTMVGPGKDLGRRFSSA